MTYWRLHYHLIWTTFERLPIITGDREKIMYAVVHQKGKELDLKIHAAGNVEDHVHLIISIPPKLSVADCVKQLKGSTSHAINHMPGAIGERSLPTVMEYVVKQKEHHTQNTPVNIYEKLDEDPS